MTRDRQRTEARIVRPGLLGGAATNLKTAGQRAALQLEMDSGAGVLRVIFAARIGVAAAPDRDVVAQ